MSYLSLFLSFPLLIQLICPLVFWQAHWIRQHLILWFVVCDYLWPWCLIKLLQTYPWMVLPYYKKISYYVKTWHKTLFAFISHQVITVTQNVWLFVLRCVLPLSAAFMDNGRRDCQRHLTTQVFSHCTSEELGGSDLKRNTTQTNCRKCLGENVTCCVCMCVCRGVMEGRRGWSVLLKEPAQWVELEGSDFVFDLMSDLELPADFPKHNSYFIISALQPAKVRPNASMWDNACTHTLSLRFHEAWRLLKGRLCISSAFTSGWLLSWTHNLLDK